MYLDPVKKTEAELDEILKLHNAELGLQPQSDGASDTSKGDQGEVNTEGQSGDQKVEDGVREPAAKTAQTPIEDGSSDTFKARYETLQGKYNAEVPRLQQEINFVRGENQTLRQQITEIQQQLRQLPQTAGEKPASAEDALDELETEYGAEFTKALDRRITNILESRFTERVKPLEDQVSQVQNRQVFMDFNGKLATRVPDWQALNTDQGFIGWLNANSDPWSGKQLLTLLNEAYRAEDLETTARFFNSYKATLAQPPANGQGQTPQQPKKQPVSTVPSPDALIQPTGQGSGAHVTAENAQGKVYTMAQVNQIYKSIELGKLTGQDAAKAEAEIWKANQEGRIVG